MSNSEPMLPPGFRFHPTDEELILHYLKNRANSIPIPVSIVAEIDIYKFDPWDLPAHALFGDREWYFFSPRDRKYPNGVRPNRAARSGYWKATGTDKPIVSSSGGNEKIGVKKALVFYRGKPPKGAKTNWIMHEYRLPESPNSSSKIYQHIPIKNRDSSSMRLDDWVLCRIYKKSNNQNLDAPSADREMEDSIIEDTYLSSFPELSTQQSNFKIPKTGSLSEFLEDNDYSMLTRFLYDNSPAVLSQEQQAGFVLSNPTTSMTNQTTTGFHNINPQIPVSIFGFDDSTNPVKRQRSSDAYFEEEEEENSTGVLLHPSKKHDSSSCVRINFSNQQITGTPNSNYFDHQFLMNSHPELH